MKSLASVMLPPEVWERLAKIATDLAVQMDGEERFEIARDYGESSQEFEGFEKDLAAVQQFIDVMEDEGFLEFEPEEPDES